MPNHRSCKFLERELDLASHGVYLMPRVVTVTDFLASLTGSVLVKPVEALFILYQCYTRIAGNENYDFDKFVYWGNVVLNDFNDVDMYLVNPEKLFKNIKEHREIQANYLDRDLQEIVSHYFNLSAEGIAIGSEEFWRNYEAGDDPGGDGVKAKYLRLWQSLYQLYEDFNRELQARGLCTMGRMYRDAVAAVKDGHVGANEKFVFVGFNMLSTSEVAVFKLLERQDRALFFWDLASAAFVNDEGINNGSQIVKFLRKEFPEPFDFSSDSIAEFPSIEVVGVPSNVGQAKYCYHLLNHLAGEGVIDGSDAIGTALVLPDDGLLVPLLNSLPPGVEKKNVTMGYPLSSSDIASLMRVVAKMHSQARVNADGEWAFYRGDVKTVLSHPIVKNYFGAEALELRRLIAEQRMFAVPQSVFEGSSLALLFTTFGKENDAESVVKILRLYIDFCLCVIDKIRASANEERERDGEDSDRAQEAPVMTLQEAFANQYIEVLNQLIDALTRYQVPPCEASVFFLIDRLAAAFSIPFEGEPLQGLQIMGMLETRCLDFETIILLSANEGMMPGKTRRNSFISDFMRRNYDMSTTMDQEMMWNYHFYRLIGRAKRVIMIYDTSDNSLGGGEVTRYVPQLELVYGCPVKRRMFTLSSVTSDPIDIRVPKTGYALQQLHTFCHPQGSRSLSASTIKEYVNCPLMFYFNKIERLRASDDDVDFMDAGTFGTIVHDTLQHLYYPEVQGTPRTGEHRVTCAHIKHFITDKLDAVVERLVNEQYLHNSSSAKLVGEASIVSVAIKKYALAALHYDIDLLNNIDSNAFTVLECECRHDIALRYGGVDFNFTYIADRIDRLPDGTLRIVDYKTGKDTTKFRSVDDLFAVTTRDKNLRGILQLMLYCNAYALEKKIPDTPIMPLIYKLRNMDESGAIYNGEQLADYHVINDDFTARMDQVIGSLFDASKPFEPSPDVNSCRYCRYIDFCRRKTQG